MKLKKYLTNILCLYLCLMAGHISAQTNAQYLVGYGKSDITYIEDGLGLFGYGDYHQRIDAENGASSRIYSRVISIKDPITDQQIIYLHADLGAIFLPLRRGVIAKIKENLHPDFDESCLMMTASHTHCAASGMSDYALYMASAPGYNPDLVAFTVNKMYESIVQALESPSLSTIEIKEGTFAPNVPIAFNRALKSYNKNKEIFRKYKRYESNLAINRNMPLMNFVDENGESRGFINWFGVHPIEVLPDHDFVNGASKGYAALYAEEEMNANDVAIFAQNSAGDVMTSDYHNSELFDIAMRDILNEPHYHHDSTSLKQAKWNGKIQAQKALDIRNQVANFQVAGKIDYELIYVNMADVEVDKKFSNGIENARTSSPALGAPFLSHSFYWKDQSFERGALNLFSNVNRTVFRIRAPFANEEEREYRKILYKTQYPKKIVIDGVEKSVFGVKFDNYQSKKFPTFFFNKMSNVDIAIKDLFRQIELGAMQEHTILPTILPIQIIRIGNVAIAGLPTEITTIAHNRLQATLLDILRKDGVREVFISSYANEYAGYTTTYEEYLVQRYEGGHTLYGKHQLGAFQTEFKKLANELLKPKSERILNRNIQAPVFSEEELKKRSHLIPLEE